MMDRRYREEPFIRERRGEGERRAHPRAPAHLPIELTTGGRVFFDTTTDLSASGARLDRPVPLAVGTWVTLTLELPNDPPPVRCRGEVTREDPEGGLGMGVRLVDASEDDLVRIERFLARAG